jgi:CheY-like chemotaxis protein
MERPINEPLRIPTPELSSADPSSTGLFLLLSRDLIFTTKVKGTAEALSYRIVVASERAQAVALIAKWQPRVVLVDLTAGDMAAPEALIAYQELAGPDAWFVAFGPHVEADALAAAKAAGCQAVMPRSKFSAELPELLRQYFHRPAINGR